MTALVFVEDRDDEISQQAVAFTRTLGDFTAVSIDVVEGVCSFVCCRRRAAMGSV